MLDILACPIDKNYPLELIELNVKELEKDKIKKNYHPLNNDEKVIVVIDGILYCKKCSRFYPIIDEIPIMLPDELREKEKDLQFLKKWKHTIPEKILTQSNPWHL